LIEAVSGTKPRPVVSKYDMDPFRLRTLIAPAMASMFLVLSLCAFVAQSPAPVGMHLPLPQARMVPHEDCDFLSDRNIVVQLQKDGNIRINETQVSHERLRPILTEIYAYRAEKFIYIVPIRIFPMANLPICIAPLFRPRMIFILCYGRVSSIKKFCNVRREATAASSGLVTDSPASAYIP
jgi:hypothetical protein